MNLTPGQIDDLKDRNPCDDIAGRWVALRKMGDHMVGPCPLCSTKNLSSKTATRFEVWRDRFVCAVCHESGDVIGLVRKREGLSFEAAIGWLGGPQTVDPAKEEERKREREAKRAEDQKAAKQFRERARVGAFETWKRADGQPTEQLLEYLQRRGIGELPVDRKHLRCQPDMPYFEDGKRDTPPLHRGPAMLAPIMRAGKFSGLHITYLDPAQPKGKLKPVNAKGEALPAKKMRGPKKGGHIELVPALADPERPRRMVLGEGIEKVGAVWCAHIRVGRAVFDTAFWTSGDMGNLGGKAVATVKHPTAVTDRGRPVSVQGPIPDMEQPGIEIPDSVEELIILGDSASADIFEAQCAVARGAARFARPGLDIRAAWSPRGEDFDETLQREGGAEIIMAIIDTARPPVAPALNAAPAAAPARTSAPRARQDQTGAGNAGAPVGLPSAAAGHDAPAPVAPDAPEDPVADALGPEPPPAAAPAEDSEKNSRNGSAGARSALRARWGGPPRKFGTGPGALDKWLAFFPMTELGLIERYAQRERNRLCFCPAMGWLWWDRMYWAREGADARAIEAGHHVARAIQDEAAAIRGTEFDEIVSTRTIKHGKGKDKTEETVPIYLSDMLERFGRDSETKSAMTLEKHARAYLEHRVEKFDADHMKLTILNGTLVFSREPFSDPLPKGWVRHNDHVRLKPHDPADLITKLAPMTYRPGATCELYDKSIETWQPDPAYRRFLDTWDGYSLTGDAAEQKLVLNIGTGKNGKSTWTALKMKLLGDYAESIPITTLQDAGKARAAGQASPDLAMLRSIRLLLTSEPPKHWKVDEGLVKDLTGGDKVSVRELHKAYFKLDPRFKLTIAGNHKPEFSAGDRNSGIWRRVVLVDWKVTIPEDERNLRLVDELIAEGSGVLNRWLEGLTQWLQFGLRIPNAIVGATEDYRADRDVLGRFLVECAEEGGDSFRAGVTETHDVFTAWMRAAGESGRHEWTPKGLSNALKERGFLQIKDSIMKWARLRLTKKASDFPAGRPSQQRAEEPPPHGEPRPKRGEEDDDIPF